MAALRLVAFSILLLVSWSASAYENPQLERAGAVYRKAVYAKHRGKPNLKAAAAAFSNAKGLARKRKWAAAIAAYEKTIALGRREAEVWYLLSNAHASRRPSAREKGLIAAINGYRISQTKVDKALGLWHVATHYNNSARPKRAFTAYEASLALVENAGARRAYKKLAVRFKLVVKRIKTDTESDTPRVCIEFSKDLDRRASLRMADYLRIDPPIKISVTTRGRNICIEGVVHGSSYQLTVLKGLPGTEKLVLEKTGRFNVVVPNREASLSFKGRAFILPTKGRQGLPINSVNVGKANVELLRINDRAIVEQIKERKIMRLLSGYDADELRQSDGESVWKGVLTIKSVPNKEVTTVIPLSDILKNRKPGIYVAVASPAGDNKEKKYKSRATQWFVVTDLGVSSYLGLDGLQVSIRSLATARVLQGVNVLLLARNNGELARGLTDKMGMIRFAPGLVRGAGGQRPAAIMAFAESGEFVFLDLTRPGFDLTDRGVGGRKAPGPVDGFLYTERGVYRPGETVRATALFRDDRAKALADLPITLKLIRPNGVEARRFRLKPGAALGGYTLDIPLPSSARTGRWTLAAYIDPKGKPVGTVRFQVEDFVPERIELALKAAQPGIATGVANQIIVAGRFLYGAPAADLRVTSELVLRLAGTPFEKFKGYQFGLVQEDFRAKRIDLKATRTDAKGGAVLPIKLAALPQTSRPLQARIRVSILEAGGRATVRTITLPVRAGTLQIGIKPGFEGAVRDGQPAPFEIIALAPDGTPIAAPGLTYELIREEHRYNWYYRNGRWNYRITISDGDTSKGKIGVAGKPAALSLKASWGAYRLEVRDKKSGAASSVRFRVGWWASASAGDVPDKLRVTLDKKNYRPGDTAKIFVRPPFAGKVQLVIAGDRVYEVRNFDVTEKGKTIEIEVKASWGPSIYVLASAFRPGADTKARGPARAIGLAHLSADMSGRTLAVKISAPAKITPRGKLEVSIQVAGITRGGTAFVTLAAVDEGILQLTGYKSPAPEKYYFGKRLLALELRDDYGKLIDPGKGAFGSVRQGGDAPARRQLAGLDASSIKTVSLFSGIVRLDGEGRAKITLDVPDFNGRLRLMAVAWDGDKIGSGGGQVIVRDAIVSVVTLPRFLAPRDIAQMTISLHNVDGLEGAYKVTVTGTLVKPIAVVASRSYRLGKGKRLVVAYKLRSMSVGIGRVKLTIEGPKGYRVERGWDLTVRPAQPIMTRRMVRRIKPGESVVYTKKMLAGFVRGTGEVTMGFSSAPNFNLAGLLKKLDRYPYGCVEQTTSRALPLLYVAELAKTLGIAEDRTILRGRVQKAVGRILTMQRSDGSFGLWSAFSPREDWLSAYVMDFLLQARKLKYPVPEAAFERGMRWLTEQVADPDFEPWQLPSRAYAFYVLAQAGKARLSNLRYFHDTYAKRMPTALALAQSGAALSLMGDKARAQAAFTSAFAFKGRSKKLWRSWRYWDYGSNLRDRSALVYLAAASRQGEGKLPAAVSDLVQLAQGSKYTSTQEQAWLLLAANQLLGAAKPMTLSVAGRKSTRSKPLFLLRKEAMLAGGLTVRNLGSAPVWHSASVSGVPRKDQPPAKSGFVIKRAFYTLSGKRADLAKIRQGDVLVAVISGEAVSGERHQALVVDLLPAGFEIENSNLKGRRKTKEMSWLPKLARTVNEEPRDDRYVAALNLKGGGKRAFVLAYLVRAVTPGTFRLPAVYVEDMYKPRFFGRDAMGSVTIAAVK